MRYRLTTPEVLHARYFPNCERNAVTKVTTRLCASEFLCAQPLYDRYIYFTLGKRGAKVQGISPSKAGLRGNQSLYREYGTLAFCMKAGKKRERIRSGEFRTWYPPLVRGKIDTSHYFLEEQENEEATNKRLGYIWVDGAGTIDHILRTLKEAIEARRQLLDFLRLIDSGRFFIGVVTLSQNKAQEISAALPTIPYPVQFYVEVVPELVHLLPRSRDV